MDRYSLIVFVFSALIISADSDDSANATNGPPDSPEAILIPVYAGEKAVVRNFTNLPMGSFPAYFGSCGKKAGVTLNEAFAGSNTKDVQVSCTPGPERVIVSDKKDLPAYTAADLKTPCSTHLLCSETDYAAAGDQTQLQVFNPKDKKPAKVRAPIFSDPEQNICHDKKATKEIETSKILLSNEDSCKITVPTTSYSIPRWLEENDALYNRRNLFYPNERKDRLKAMPFHFTNPTVADTRKFTPCGSSCDLGTIVKQTMKTGQYRSMIYLTKECPAFRICFKPKDFDDNNKVPLCQNGGQMDVLISAGVVSWPNNGRASIIELRGEKDELTAIEFGYGWENENKVQAEFYIGNAHREYVTSDSNGFSGEMASQVVFFFPTEDCLLKGAGIVSQNVEVGQTLVTNETDVTNTDPAGAVGGSEITGTQEETFQTTTTEKPDVIELTTTVSPPIANLNSSKFFEMQIGAAGVSNAVYQPGKWWTWALYLGLVVGSLLVTGIGGGVFYLMRRTVFAFWYRGMYKRYGCDASGTTGGVTGAGFGNTTTGALTMGNTTTGGGGGGNTTSMGGTTSTMGGTTSNNTSSVKTLAL